MNKKLKRDIEIQKDFSGTIFIEQEGKIIFEKAYGLAHTAFNIKNKIDTKYGIASGAKLFTSVAICQLIDKGIINIDTLLKDCLSIPYHNYDERITIKHLLTHTSGIPDYFEEEDINAVEDFSDIYSNPPMYMLKNTKDHLKLFKNKPMEFEPGTKFDYTNAGYILLGLVLEEKSGLSFREYVKLNIIDKLELKNTGYFSMDSLPIGCSYGYTSDKNGNLKLNIYSLPIIGGPDGGIFTNAYDMSEVLDNLLNFKLLSESLTKELLKPQTQCGDNCYYGYGIFIIKKGDYIYKYFLPGGDPGAEFMTAIYPNSKTKVIVFPNRDTGANNMSLLIEKSLNL